MAMTEYSFPTMMPSTSGFFARASRHEVSTVISRAPAIIAAINPITLMMDMPPGRIQSGGTLNTRRARIAAAATPDQIRNETQAGRVLTGSSSITDLLRDVI